MALDIKDIIKEARSYSFFQAVRILKNKTKSNDDIKIKPNISLGFPHTDISKIEKTKENKLEITANFLGLLGTTSPLPIFYTEDIIYEIGNDITVNKDFFELVNFLFYRNLYNIWVKYKILIKLFEEKDEKYFERFASLFGFFKEDFKKTSDSSKLLRYIGIFSLYPRNKNTLETLLKDFFNLKCIKIKENIKRTVKIQKKQYCFLGSKNSILKKNCYLGSSIKDSSRKFEIQIGPLNYKIFSQFLPHNTFNSELKKLLKIFLNKPFLVDLKLIINIKNIQTSQLGKPNWGHLGYNTWIFSNKLNENKKVSFEL